MSLEQDFTRYPISIYTRGVRFVLAFVLPFAFMNYFPATYLLHKTDTGLSLSPWVGLLTPVIGLAWARRRLRLLALRPSPLSRDRLVRRGAFLGCAGAALLASHATRADAATVTAKIRRIARAMPGRIGVYARTLAPGAPIVAYDASHRFPTASIIKVLIMTTAYAVDETEPGALSARVTYHSGELIGGSDFMSQARDGKRFTVRELIVPMIQLSDNTAANMLIGHFGVATINAVGRRAGLKRTHLARQFMDFAAIAHHNDNVSTPADMGHLLYLIERGAREGFGTIVSARHCREMVAIMLGQTDRDGIPAALPHGTSVANKTGEVDGTRNDIAIVEPFGDSPFILAIMTADAYDYAAAYAAIHAVTRATYAEAAHSYE